MTSRLKYERSLAIARLSWGRRESPLGQSVLHTPGFSRRGDWLQVGAKSVINPRRACAGGLRLLVLCVCVCVCVLQRQQCSFLRSK